MILLYGMRMTMSNLEDFEALEYSESVWRNLGHRAFDNDNLLEVEDIEWWDFEDDTDRD